MNNKHSSGVWIIVIIGVLLNIVYLFGQTMTVFNYDFAVSVGLQEPVCEITEVGVALNKGFGLADTIFYIPVFIVGIIGLLKRKTIGLYLMFAAMAVTVYWPIVSLATVFYAKGTSGFEFSDYTVYSIILSLISLYGLWGLWFLYRKRAALLD